MNVEPAVNFEVTLQDRYGNTPVWKKIVVAVPRPYSGLGIEPSLRHLACYISDLTSDKHYQDDHGHLYSDHDFDTGYGVMLGMGRIEPTNSQADLVLVHYDGYGLAAENASKEELKQLYPTS